MPRPDALPWFNSWFAGRGHKLSPSENFFEAGAIDSFGIIELIEDIEGHFNIAFRNSDFQDPRFSSIAGLAELVAEK